MDLMLTLVNGTIKTKTYQKAMDLYLCLPPTSSHPYGCIKGTIYGLARRYITQNTHHQEYVYFAVLLFGRLLERGWDPGYTRPLILKKACSL